MFVRGFEPRMKLVIPYDFQKFDISQEHWDKAFAALADECDVVLTHTDKTPYDDPDTAKVFAASIIDMLSSCGCFDDVARLDFTHIIARHNIGTTLTVC